MPDPASQPARAKAPAGDPAGNLAGRRPHWPGFLAIAAMFVASAALSWRKWPDPLIDFGQQLYVPWRLSRGALLYHDVSYVYGCLSVCYHAALFKIFGVSLNVLLVSNFLIFILLLLLVYRLFANSTDAWTAATCGLALTVLAFGQFLDVGNYNYICPYSHEAFHGVVLAVLMMACLTRWLSTGRKLPVALAGVCLGLIFLTKPEIFVGAAAPFVVAVILQWRRISLLELAKALVLAAGCSLIPLAGFFFWFRSEMNSADALRAIFGAWLPLLHSTGLQLPIYQRNLGLDSPWLHIGRALLEFCGLAVIVGLCGWRLTRPTLTPLERVLLFAAVGGVSINYGWQKCGHCLPLLLLVAAILWWREWNSGIWRLGSGVRGLSPETRTQNPEPIFPALWLAYSLAMLAKLGFNPRVSQFGIFLAMPAFLSAIYLLLHLLPRALASGIWDLGSRVFPQNPEPETQTQTKTFRTAMMIFLLVGLARLTLHSALFYSDKDFALGSGGDRIVTYDPKNDPTGAVMAAAVTWIGAHTTSTNTLAVLPEGVMLNYLTRRENPTPYAVFAFEVWAFGEQNMLAAYQKSPPDYIAFVQRDSSEYGVAYFGEKGFGYDLMQWVGRNYEPVELIGSEPRPGGAFGIKILKRLPSETTAKQTPN